jgi:tricarballylate dehydrogenase
MVETISEFDVVVVGHGVSGLSAGLAAYEAGATPVILEKSPREDRGGHTRFAGGAFRTPIDNPDEVTEELDIDATLDRYTKDDFYADLMDVSNNRADPELCEILVNNAYETILWLTDHGLEWRKTFSDETGYGTTRGAVQAEWEGFERGKAVVEVLGDRAEDLGIDLHYLTEMRELLTNDSNEVIGVIAHGPDR